MSSIIRKINHISLFLMLALSLTIVSCGGGGGSSSGVTDPSPTSQTTDSTPTGSVTVLFTDGPTDEFSEINITITEIELLSDETKVLLFSGEKTIDLLKLEGESSLFTVSSDVPAIEYNKIRCQVTNIELKDLDGAIIDPYKIKLPGNGKLDLNPRSSFRVEPDGALIIQIDLDAEKSIHITTTGHEDKYIFRPVVFINIIDGLFAGKLVRIEGSVEEIGEESFTLCTSDTIYRAATADHDQDYDEGPDHLTDRCITVNVSGETSFFNSNGAPVDFTVLVEGGFVSAIGRFRSEEMGNEKHLPVFDAEVIEAGTFLTLKGTIYSPLNEGGFDFLIDPNQGFEEGAQLTVLLKDGTKIFSDTGAALERSSLSENKHVTIDGIVGIEEVYPPLFHSALIIVETTEIPDLMEIEGTASNIDYEGRIFDLTLSETETVCVKVPANALIFLTPASLGTEGVGEGSVEFDYLTEEDEVEALGYYDATDCFVVDTLWIEVEGDIVIE